MWIMVAGPYSSGGADAAARAENLRRLNKAALAVLAKGHLPVVGVNMALPMIECDPADDAVDRIMMPVSLALAERCDALLRIDGASAGADAEMARFAARKLPIYRSVKEVPEA